jgi:hypothetical protein
VIYRLVTLEKADVGEKGLLGNTTESAKQFGNDLSAFFISAEIYLRPVAGAKQHAFRNNSFAYTFTYKFILPWFIKSKLFSYFGGSLFMVYAKTIQLKSP